MLLVYAYFVVNVVLVLYGIRYLWQLSFAISRTLDRGKAIGVAVFAIMLGLLGIAATAPALFWDQPYWLVDKLFAVLEGVAARFRP